MKTHVKSIDGECWRIIKEGNLAIVDAHNEEIKEENFTEIEYKKDQKNHIAIKLITTGLSSSDRRKVLAYRTAKEKWDELEKIYREPDVPGQISSTSNADVPPKEKEPCCAVGKVLNSMKLNNKGRFCVS